MEKTPLGVRVQDKVTGFEGVVTGRVEYITGCNQLLVVPRVKSDGALVEAQWFDEQRTFIVDPTPVALDNGDTPGCDIPAPVR